jgi:acyl-CoA synthetase (AMP-forming)/AMP-acid ligase II
MEATAAERYTSGGPGAEPDVASFPAAFQQTVARLGDGDAIIDGERSLSWNELREQARAVAGGLAGIGVGKGDTVALMLNNRLEFFPIDLGAVTLGAVPFSIYQTASPSRSPTSSATPARGWRSSSRPSSRRSRRRGPTCRRSST